MGVADVGLEKLVSRVPLQVAQGGWIAGVGQLIDIENLVASRKKKTNEIGADETGTTSDEDFHKGKRWSEAKRRGRRN